MPVKPRRSSSAIKPSTREIQQANQVVDGSSTLNTHPGTLSLSSTDELGIPVSVIFSVSSDRLRLSYDGENSYLTNADLRIDNLVFRKFTSSRGQAVKVELTLTDITSQTPRTEKFYSTAVLRNSY